MMDMERRRAVIRPALRALAVWSGSLTCLYGTPGITDRPTPCTAYLGLFDAGEGGAIFCSHPRSLLLLSPLSLWAHLIFTQPESASVLPVKKHRQVSF
jgi:hypothetical protein